MSGYSHKISATQSIGEKFQSFVSAKMRIELKSLTLIAATLIFVLFSFLPTWQLGGNFPSQLAVAAPASSVEVGTIPGEFAVNGNGGATYTVPIEVPPGTNGVQPNLSLVYNSQQGNGLLGVGWELAGLSAIARCGKTIATDGVRGGVDFNNDDRFCFDGQRLMAVSGNYGANGTEYRTERETWVRVISHTESGKNGPRSFTVTTKDGHQMEFGNTDDSRILARGRSDGAVRVWALNKISDRNGNFVDVSYQEDASRVRRSISRAFLGYYPTAVRYTGNSNVTPQRLVKFEYENRNDNIIAYVGGSEAETTKRLARIKTYVDLDGDGNSIETANNLVKEYRLAYEYGTATGRSLLTQLEECDAVGVCLPPTAFSYENGKQEFGRISQWIQDFGCEQGWCKDNYIRTLADVNGDGLSDVVGFSEGRIFVSTSNGTSFEPGKTWIQDFGCEQGWCKDNYIRTLADVNGDGLSDVVGFSEGRIFVSTSNGTSFEPGKTWIQDFGCEQGWCKDNYIRTLADVNGDGLSDVVGFSEGRIFVSTSNGTSFEPGKTWIQDFGCEQGWCKDNYIRTLADVNGDGLSDVVGFSEGRIFVSTSNGTSFEPGKTWIQDFGCEQGWCKDNYIRTLVDVNGDGLSDVVGFSEGRIFVSTSNGTSFEPGKTWIQDFGCEQGWCKDNYIRTLVDVNGDGLSDVVGFSEGRIFVSTSNGTSFEPGKTWIQDFGCEQGWCKDNYIRTLVDVNGDGLSDVVGFSEGRILVSTSEGRSERLTTITNGLGGQTQIEYKPLTDSTVYTKEVTETENNGTANSANGLGSTDVVVRGNISSSSDEDWFAFDIPSPREITISVASDNNQNLNWFLYQESNLSQPVKQGNSTNNPEEGTYNATNPGRYYLKINGYGGDTSPYTLTLHSSDTIVRVQNSMYVVSQHTIKDKATNPTNTFIYNHQYEGAKVDRHRGWLGFEKTILIDNQNQTKTITTHHTDFPLLGMIDDQEIWDLEHQGDLLGKTASSYESSPKDSNGIYKFWKTAVALEHYTEGTYNYTLKRTYQYDSNYQNVTVTSDLGDVTDANDNVYTCLAYENGTGADWWKSFYPSQQKIVNSAAGCNNFSNWNASTDLRWEQFGYDGQMNLTSHSNWRDKSGPDDTQEGKWLTTTTGYDTYGNVTSLTDPLGNTSSTTYESKYHTFPQQRTTPSPSAGSQSLTVRTTYEPKFGIKTQVVDPNGHTTMAIADSGIDGFGRVLEIQGIKPDSNDLVTLNKTEFLAEASGMSVKTSYRTEWNGSNTPDNTWLWEREYIDGLGRTYQTESKGDDGKIITNTVQFNSVGQTARESLPYYAGETGNFLAYEYNVHGYLIKTTDPVGAVTQINYDKLDDDRQTTYYSPDPRNNASGTDLVESLVKDTSRSWVKEKKAPDSSSASYSYDRLGQVTTITDPLGQNTNMAYNSLGQLISETTAETGTTKYSYNDNGKLASQIDAKNQKISLEYDNLGRTCRKQVYNSNSSLEKTITYEYDDSDVDNGKGALTKIVMPKATYTFAYDNRGQVKEEAVKIDTDGNSSQETYLSQYTYDAAGRPDIITYPDGAEVRHTYYDGGELKRVALKDTGESGFTTIAAYYNYTALGDIGEVLYRNNVESNYTYDAIGRITTSTTEKGAHTYFNFNYTWNKANKLRALTDNAQKGLSQNFGYDIVGRLESASGPYPNLSYEYDRAGNITKRNDTTYNYKTDKKHQLAAATYDANGNTTQYAPWSYSYDAQNRLSQVDKAGSGTVNQFTYDDFDNRLSKKEADGTTTYYVASLYEVVRKADNAQIHTKYIVGPQGPIAAISKNGSNVNLLAAIHTNGARLEASLYNPSSWGGLAKFVQGKLNQLAFAAHVDQSLVAFVLISWLLCTLLLWIYRIWRSASPDSWTGKNRAMVARALASLGWIAPETATGLNTPDNPGWLLQTWHRPVSFALALVSFSTVSLTGSSVLAASLTPGANGDGYPVAGETLFFHYDQLGSTTLVTDENANQVSQINYEPYGAIANSSTGQDVFRPKFTGKEYDSKSELYYFGARYYDGHLGRFLTPDPARQYFSPYVYGNGDPLSGIDPNGAQFIALLIIGIGALVGGYMGGAAVNHSYNPASWDWSSGKTWGGILGGAAIGGAAAGVGVAAGGAIAAAGLGTIGTAVAEMAVAGGVMGTMNASFTAMAGGSIGDVAKSFGIGFGMGALFAVPGVGQVAFAGMVGYDTYKTIADPSVGNGIQLGIDILFLGMEAGMRLSKGGREYAEVGGCASFAAGTEVATAEGEKAIEEVAVGDTVLAYNEETGEEGEYPVTHLFTRIAPESMVVTVGEEAITTTPEHEFYTANGWVEAEDLSVGDTLVQLSGKTATVTDLESRDSTRVYNFEVDEAHTYYVSGKELLVHNPRCTAQEANNIRANQNLGPTDRNIAIGDLTTQQGARVYNEYGVSGARRYGGVEIPRNQNGRFQGTFNTFDVGGHSRALDSEVHLLEHLDRQIRSGSIGANGTLRIYSERYYCNSCGSVIEQFSRRYPNITIDTYYGQDQYSQSIRGGLVNDGGTGWYNRPNRNLP